MKKEYEIIIKDEQDRIVFDLIIDKKDISVDAEGKITLNTGITFNKFETRENH